MLDAHHGRITRGRSLAAIRWAAEASVSTPRGASAVAALLIVGCATRPASTEEWVSILSGTWGWVQGENTCETNPHEIAFSPDRKWMHLKTTHPILTPKGIGESEFQYQILSVT